MDPSVRYAKDMESQGYKTHMWSNGPYFVYAVHDHPYDKVIVVLDGAICFELPRQAAARDMKAGDRLVLPAGTPHSAVVGPEGVTCLEGQKTTAKSSQGGF